MKSFVFHRRVNFYETDAMGVVHHSNHIRYFEEARGAWFRDRGADKITWEKGYGFPVVDVSAHYIKPAKFDEALVVKMQLRQEGVRIHFRYALMREKDHELLATGSSTHVPIDKNFKVCKLPKAFTELLEREPWTETWP